MLDLCAASALVHPGVENGCVPVHSWECVSRAAAAQTTHHQTGDLRRLHMSFRQQRCPRMGHRSTAVPPRHFGNSLIGPDVPSSAACGSFGCRRSRSVPHLRRSSWLRWRGTHWCAPSNCQVPDAGVPSAITATRAVLRAEVTDGTDVPCWPLPEHSRAERWVPEAPPEDFRGVNADCVGVRWRGAGTGCSHRAGSRGTTFCTGRPARRRLLLLLGPGRRGRRCWPSRGRVSRRVW